MSDTIITTTADGEQPIPSGIRIAGFDIARGIALFIMIVLNFKSLFMASNQMSIWMYTLLSFFDRRAAAALVMIAGIGMTYLSGISLKNNRLHIKPGCRKILFHRSLFLFLAGCLLYLTWVGDILHFYAIFIWIGICFLKVSGRTLLTLAVISWVTGFLYFAEFITFDTGPVAALPIFTHLDSILFSGFYPVFPWACLVLAGIWIGRQDIHQKLLKKRTLGLGLLFMALPELIASFVLYLANIAEQSSSISPKTVNAISLLADWTHIDMIVPTPLSIISGLGSGLCIILTGLFLSHRLKPRWTTYLAAVGKTSLSLYLFHILFIINGLMMMGLGQKMPIVATLFLALLFYGFWIIASYHWLKRFQHGPFEILMRRFPFAEIFFFKKSAGFRPGGRTH